VALQNTPSGWAEVRSLPAMDAEVVDIEVDRGAMELRVRWDDGFTGALSLTAMRLACPCAGCRGSRDRGEEPWPTARSPRPLGIDHAELVGAWGLGIRWNDGHETGIYPFEAIRRWCERDHIDLPGDSGFGAYAADDTATDVGDDGPAA